MTASLSPSDLPLLERVYLGVLATGIVPARLAGEPLLRMDYLTAVCVAIVEGHPQHLYVIGEGPELEPVFAQRLLDAALSLDARAIISAGTTREQILSVSEEVMARPLPPKTIDFDQHPRILDRYLAQQCMESLFQDPAVYPFLMGKYQDSGEIWGRLYQQGYGRWR